MKVTPHIFFLINIIGDTRDSKKIRFIGAYENVAAVKYYNIITAVIVQYKTCTKLINKQFQNFLRKS